MTRKPRKADVPTVLSFFWAAAVIPAAAFFCSRVAAETPYAEPERFFGIRVVDDRTGRGVPLMELETVHQLRFVTDSGGWVAVDEPELMDRRVFFSVRGHGYQHPRDGFGFAGTALEVKAGEQAEIRVRRLNRAERIYRVTGQGIYRDSVLLGRPVPLSEPLGSGGVAGQDSAFAVPYRNRIYWFWGDTNKLAYPLGHYWMAGAVSELPGRGGLDPGEGIDLRYFTDDEGFSRPVARLGLEKGMIWADTFTTVSDAQGRERLVTRYAHMESLNKMLAHGLAIFNDQTEEFDLLRELPLELNPRFPAQAHPIPVTEEGRQYRYFGGVFPTVRVPADLESFVDPDRYEYFTCLSDDSTADDPRVRRDADGALDYRWARNTIPMDEQIEGRLLADGQIELDEAHFHPRDVESDSPIRMHRGSVNWNDYRDCWIMIAGRREDLGEIWYSEAASPTGPWLRCIKIVSHDRYSFYNPVHHRFFDQQDGKIIFFEGTYTHAFSAAPVPTPRYDYNQIMYRLDLDEVDLKRGNASSPEN